MNFLAPTLIGTNIAPVSKLDIVTDGIGITQTNASGISIMNTTSATLGNQQYSPALRWRGQGWGTTAGTSQSVDYRLAAQTIQGTVPTGNLLLEASINGGTYVGLFNFGSTGAHSTAGNIAAGNFNTGGTVTMTGANLTRPGIATTSTDGYVMTNLGGSTASIPVQQSPRIRISATAWNTSTLASQVGDFIIENRPTSANPISTKLAIAAQINAGGYTDVFTLTNAGNIATPGGITSQGTVSGVVLTFTNTFNGGNLSFVGSVLTNARNSIATTSSDGLVLSNATASTSGVPIQYSSRSRFSGTAWNTTALASQVSDFIIENRPVSGNPITGLLAIASQVNAAGYTDVFTLTSAGVARAQTFQTNNLTVGATVITVSSGANNAFVDGILLTNPNAATSGTTQKWGNSINFQSSAWTGSAAQSSNFRIGNEAIDGTSPITAKLVVQSQINGGGYTDRFTISDNGATISTGSVTNLYTSTATSITLGNHRIIEITATGQTITLPTAVGIAGREYTMKLTATGSCTIATTSSQTIDGLTTYSLAAQYKYVTVVSNGTGWLIIENN